jgi:excinuclease UvrABC nuclease subunit
MNITTVTIKHEIELDGIYVLRSELSSVAENIAGIYILFQDEEIIYIGKSIDIKKRIKTHSWMKYDHICIVPIEDEHYIDKIELSLIHHYQPINNSQGTSHLNLVGLNERR